MTPPAAPRTLQEPPLPRRDHQPWRLALLPLLLELSRRRRDNAYTRYRGDTRGHPPVVFEVRAGLRQSAEASTRPARGQMAPRRGLFDDQREAPLSVACRGSGQ